MITLQFQFGKTEIKIDDPPAIIQLDYGYIAERHLSVRIIEGVLSLGLIALGVERLCQNKKRKKKSQSI
jgi:hypothetical protein